MKPLIIGVCGIKRSGSTVQFNLIRLALEMAGYDVIPFGHKYNPDQSPKEGEAYLCKRHPFDQRLANEADHIFLTDRPDEEIIESLTKFNGIKPGQSHIDNMRKHLDRWKGYTDHIHLFYYSTWEKFPITYTEAIIDTLGLNINRVDVLEAFNEIEPPESGQDPKTLLFSNHISNYDK